MARNRPNRRKRVAPAVKVGVAPGSAVYVGAGRDHAIAIHLLDYDTAGVRETSAPTPEQIAQCRGAATTTWLDLDGVHDPGVVQQVGDLFELHPLWVEDVLNPTSRPKIEWLGDRLFVLLRVVTAVGESPEVEQVALVLGPRWVLSFQERPGDVWEPVRQRIREGQGRVRQRGADFLLHALMDAVVDAYFAVLQTLDLRIEALEADALDPGVRDLLERLADIKADVDLLRGAVWPLRDAVATLIRGEGQLIEARTLPFFRDLGDHVANLIEQVDAQRERLRSAADLHLAMSSRQLNDVMRVLTLVSTLFMPLTFVVGVYGMNFDHMPELHWIYGYPLVLGAMIVMVVGMIALFRKRGWL